MTINIERKPITMLVIDDKESRVDPIRVICENFEPGRGRIIIVCWDRAWCGYWGAMSGASIEQFFVNAYPGYLAGNLTGGLGGLRLKSREKGDDAYLMRIIAVVQNALRTTMRQDLHGTEATPCNG